MDRELRVMCSAEHSEFYEHCVACNADYAALADRLEQQAKDSQEIVERLGREGVQMPAHLVIAAQVEALTHAVFNTRRARMLHDHLVGDKVLAQLQEGQRQLAAHTDALITPDRTLHVVKR